MIREFLLSGAVFLALATPAMAQEPCAAPAAPAIPDGAKATQAQLARGQRLVEILKQPQYRPMNIENQVLVIWAASNGYADDVAVEDVRGFEDALLKFVENSHPGVLQSIREKKSLTDEIILDLKQVLADFKESWTERSESGLDEVAVQPATAGA